MTDVQVFVGYDSNESAACHVCAESIRTYNKAVDIQFLKQPLLRARRLYLRPPDEQASTEFSLTRFLTPALASAKYAIFCDGDFIFRDDITRVLKEVDPDAVVSCVQHDYTPKQKTKMDGKVQYEYPRKNWSSFMVFNVEKAKKILTHAVVNTATPAYLHQFQWAEPAKLDRRWNHLVGEYPKDNTANGVHFTNGGPWHGVKTDWDREWSIYRDALLQKEWVNFYYFPKMPLYEMIIPGVSLGDPRLSDPKAFDHKLDDWGKRRGYTVYETLKEKGQINPTIGLWENNRWRIEPGQARWLGMHYMGWKTQKVVVAVRNEDHQRFEYYKQFEHEEIKTKDRLASLFIGDTWDGYTGHGYFKRRFRLFFDLWNNLAQ
jgi:hypothetical protein